MKNKKSIYLLVILVVAIWGLIIFRIVRISHKEPVYQVSNKSVATIEKYELVSDSFILVANYPDPFLKNIVKNSPRRIQGPTPVVTSRSKNKPGKEKAEVAKKVNWPAIQYGGLIHNNKSNKTTGLLIINGNSNIMEQGNTYEELTLERLFNDSCIVLFNNEHKTIYLK